MAGGMPQGPSLYIITRVCTIYEGYEGYGCALHSYTTYEGYDFARHLYITYKGGD